MNFQPKSAVMLSSAGYRWAQFAPHPALARWVSAYWTIETGPGKHLVRSLPDACIDLTLRLGRVPQAFIAGVQRHNHNWPIHGRMHLVGARLLPGTARLLGIDASTLPSAWTPLEGFLCSNTVHSLIEAAAVRSASDPQRVAVLEAFTSWAAVAIDLGYHDQAHFVHDVRELFGMTPSELTARAGSTR